MADISVEDSRPVDAAEAKVDDIPSVDVSNQVDARDRESSGAKCGGEASPATDYEGEVVPTLATVSRQSSLNAQAPEFVPIFSTSAEEPQPADDAQGGKAEGGDKAAAKGKAKGHKTLNLSDEAKEKMLTQLEFYFSDTNLPSDNHLLQMLEQGGGYASLKKIAGFRKIRSLCPPDTPGALIMSALADLVKANSTFLELNESRKGVKRVIPLPAVDIDDLQNRTVVAENLPSDHSIVALETLFGKAGRVRMVRVCSPSADNGANRIGVAVAAAHSHQPGGTSKGHHVLTNKLHALVEFESVEEAEKAVELLNNTDDWRRGLHVKQLKQRKKGGHHNQQQQHHQKHSHNHHHHQQSSAPGAAAAAASIESMTSDPEKTPQLDASSSSPPPSSSVESLSPISQGRKRGKKKADKQQQQQQQQGGTAEGGKQSPDGLEKEEGEGAGAPPPAGALSKSILGEGGAAAAAGAAASPSDANGSHGGHSRRNGHSRHHHHARPGGKEQNHQHQVGKEGSSYGSSSNGGGGLSSSLGRSGAGILGELKGGGGGGSPGGRSPGRHQIYHGYHNQQQRVSPLHGSFGRGGGGGRVGTPPKIFGSPAPGSPLHGIGAAIKCPRMPDGTKGFSFGRGKAMAPPPAVAAAVATSQ